MRTHPDCTGKDKLTRAKAKAIVNRKHGPRGMKIYKCESCKDWHVGTSGKILGRAK